MVASVLRPGGSGFYALNWDGHRIAYLQCLDKLGNAQFYELWNEKEWAKLIGENTPLDALQKACDDGSLSLRHLIRRPTGNMRRQIEYDLTDVIIRPRSQGGVVLICGWPVPKRIFFDSPHGLLVKGAVA